MWQEGGGASLQHEDNPELVRWVADYRSMQLIVPANHFVLNFTPITAVKKPNH